MDASTLRKSRQIFAEVSALPADQQEAALVRLCGGDAEVLAQVRKLLGTAIRPFGSATEMPTLAAEPVQAPVSVDIKSFVPREAPPEEKSGTYIGPYKLLQQLGEGGFGSVFMAEQEKPVKRRVALKIIKLGMDTRQVVARFEQERQALALMDHPNIAKVFDAGTTSTGRPYFVMELCRGEPITDYCDKNSVAIPDRLALMMQVCQAVQHAHQKGLIHRDIKPSNVLVSVDDGRASIKVIDFGIAKATSRSLTDKTLHTEQAQMIGTPQYMSPEQAEGSPDIDTRTDVYALGVMLYELLTGSTPFDAKTLRSATYADIPRIIRETEPAKPSARLRQHPETVVTVAAQRHTEPRKLSIIVRGELDWIVMKAVEKERQRRYDSASDLAADIQRYLNGEPVVAAPPSRAYLLKKFIRRNRVMVMSGSAVAAALIVGIVAFAWQAKVARFQRDLAVKAQKAEEEQRLIAKKRADDLKLVSDFQAGMLAQVDPTLAGQELTADVTQKFLAALVKANVPPAELSAQTDAFKRLWGRVNATDAARELIDRTILKPAIKAIDEQFKGQPVVDAQLRQVLADRYLDLGLYDSAQPLMTRALATRQRELGEDHPDTLSSLNSMGILLQRQGKLVEAEPYYRAAMEKRRRVLGNENPDTLQSIGWLGYLLDEQRRFSEAEPLLRETLETSRRVLGEEHPTTLDGIAVMGTRLAKQGKRAEAEPYLREALEKRRRVLGEEHRDIVASLSNLGDLLLAERRNAEAEPIFREGLDKSRRVLGEDHPYTLSLANGLGKALQAQGKLADAEPYLRETLDKRRRVLGEQHPETLISINNMAGLLRDEGKLTEAEPYYLEALQKTRSAQGDEHADTIRAVNNVAMLLRNQGRLAEAEPYYLEALEKSRRVLGDEHADTLRAINNMGVLLWSQQKYSQAEPYLLEALELRRRILGEDHQDTLISINNLGGVMRDQGKLAEAATYYAEALDGSRRALGQDNPNTLIFQTNMGGVLVAQGKHGEAIDLLAAAESKVRKAFPGANSYRVGILLTSLGRARTALSKTAQDFAAAEVCLLEANEIFAKAPGPSPKDAREAILATVELYTAWDKAEPQKGYDSKAAAWKSKLGAPATQPKP